MNDDGLYAVHMVPLGDYRHELRRGFYKTPIQTPGLPPIRVRVTITPCGCDGACDWVVEGVGDPRVFAPRGWSRKRPTFVAGSGVEIVVVIIDESVESSRTSNDLVRERLMRACGLEN